MSTKAKMILVSVMISGAMLIPQVSYAGAFGNRDKYCPKGGEERHKKGRSPQERFDNMVEELGLSGEQQEQLRQQKETRRQEHQELREALREAQEALKEELSREDIDQSKLDSIAGGLKQLNNRMVDDRIEGILKMREILTPDQYRKFQEKAQKMHGKMSGKMREGMHGEKGGY